MKGNCMKAIDEFAKKIPVLPCHKCDNMISVEKCQKDGIAAFSMKCELYGNEDIFFFVRDRDNFISSCVSFKKRKIKIQVFNN